MLRTLAKRSPLCVERPFAQRSFTFLAHPPRAPLFNRTSTTRTQSLLTRHSSSSSTISDPSRPDLFYHLVSLPTPTPTPAYAVSFLTQPPPTPDSCSVVGWLPAETAGQQDAEAGLNDFVQNRTSNHSPPSITDRPQTARFRAIMHEAIQRGLQERVDDIWINGALQLQQGWMHIHGMSHASPFVPLESNTTMHRQPQRPGAGQDRRPR
jgi:hypothetical protein